jgi:hypothetical protein
MVHQHHFATVVTSQFRPIDGGATNLTAFADLLLEGKKVNVGPVASKEVLMNEDGQ